MSKHALTLNIELDGRRIEITARWMTQDPAGRWTVDSDMFTTMIQLYDEHAFEEAARAIRQVLGEMEHSK